MVDRLFEEQMAVVAAAIQEAVDEGRRSVRCERVKAPNREVGEALYRRVVRELKAKGYAGFGYSWQRHIEFVFGRFPD